MVAVMVALPRLLPWLTLPFSSTDTTSGSLLLQVIFPAEPSGIKVTVRVMGLGHLSLRVNSLLLRVKPVAVCPTGMVSPGVSATGGVLSPAGSVSDGLASGVGVTLSTGVVLSAGPSASPLATRGRMMVMTMMTAATIRARETTVPMIFSGEVPPP